MPIADCRMWRNIPHLGIVVVEIMVDLCSETYISECKLTKYNKFPSVYLYCAYFVRTLLNIDQKTTYYLKLKFWAGSDKYCSRSKASVKTIVLIKFLDEFPGLEKYFPISYLKATSLSHSSSITRLSNSLSLPQIIFQKTHLSFASAKKDFSFASDSP